MPFGIHFDEGGTGCVVRQEGIQPFGNHFHLVERQRNGVRVKPQLSEDSEILKEAVPSLSERAICCSKTFFNPFKATFMASTLKVSGVGSHAITSRLLSRLPASKA